MDYFCRGCKLSFKKGTNLALVPLVKKRIPMMEFVFLSVNVVNSEDSMSKVGSKGYSAVFYGDEEVVLLSSYNY